MTGTLRRLGLIVPALALVVAGIGVLAGTGLVRAPVAALRVPAPAAGWFAVGVALTAAAQLAMLRVQVGTGTVGLAWGESAIVVLCVVVPLAWIPVVAMVGVGLARAIQYVRLAPPPPWEIVYDVGVLTLATATGSALANPPVV